MSERVVSARLTDSQFQALVDLAAQAGTDANTALQNAIETTKFLADNVGKDDKLQILRPNNKIATVVFDGKN